VLAERLTGQLDKRVLLVDRRPHIGGNAYDELRRRGVLIHRYGPHIFHTNSRRRGRLPVAVHQWRPYEHRVLASVKGGQLVPIPINRTTLNKLYGLAWTATRRRPSWPAAPSRWTVRTSEDVVVSAVGRELYEQVLPRLHPQAVGHGPVRAGQAVTARVPTRTNTDDRYFADKFQAMPAARLHPHVREHARPSQHQGDDRHGLPRDVRREAVYDHLIYTGPIDEYFDFKYGKLPYRSLRFEHETLDQEWFQAVGTVNYPTRTPYTRISEYKHMTGQSHAQDPVTYEFPCAEGDPYYPVPRPENQALYKRYEAWRRRPRTSPSSAGWRPTATTTWTRWSGRRWRRSAGSPSARDATAP
jgi:UDP-galactopyranose mutase